MENYILGHHFQFKPSSKDDKLWITNDSTNSQTKHSFDKLKFSFS